MKPAADGPGRSHTSTAAAGNPIANLAAARVPNESRVVRRRPKTVPSPQRVAAPNASKTGANRDAEASEGLGNATRYAPTNQAPKNHANGQQPLSDEETGSDDHHQGLHFLQEEWCGRISVSERCSEQRCGKGRRSCADQHKRRPVTSVERSKRMPIAPEDRKGHQHQDHVLEKDQGRRRKLESQPATKQGVSAPQGGPGRDEAKPSQPWRADLFGSAHRTHRLLLRRMWPRTSARHQTRPLRSASAVRPETQEARSTGSEVAGEHPRWHWQWLPGRRR